MQIATIMLIALGLAMDALAVSLGISTSGQIGTRGGKLRLAAHFGIFQAGMTGLGWLAGATIVRFVEGWDHWIAFVLLAYVGINLIRSGWSADGKAFPHDPSAGRLLIMLSVATSIDAFAVGLSIAILRIPVLVSALVIGFTTLCLSLLGLFGGGRLGQAFGKRMEMAGGVVLLAIGIRVVVTHTLG